MLLNRNSCDVYFGATEDGFTAAAGNRNATRMALTKLLGTSHSQLQ